MSSAGGGGGWSAPSSSPQSSSFIQGVAGLGLGYAVGIALGSLVLLSTVLLASYVCCRAADSRRRSAGAPVEAFSPARGAVVGLPHIIFVADDDDDDDDDEGAPGRTPVQGLDQAAINSYPKFPFSKSSSKAAGGDAVCAICLCEYREGEMLRVMPDCRHGFHLTCVDAWLRLNASCPVCRTSPMPTPLSEVVPLSRYAADRHRR